MRHGTSKNVALLLLAAGLGWLANGQASHGADTVGTPLLTDAVVRVARDRDRSVVVIHVLERPRLAPNAVSPDGVVQPVGETLGSGVVIDDRGSILTNEHVIRSGAVIHVRRSDGSDVPASVVGTDPDTDLALLRVSETTGLSPAPLGDSDAAEVGSFVVAIGSPLGLHHTVTTGVLSAKARGLDNSGQEFLQTDAAVNPGSSGGPLFDLHGAVIGLVTAILSDGGQNAGLNFAVPINTAKELLPALRANRVTHAWLGMATSGLSAAGAEALGVGQSDAGLLISAVEGDGPAARAGIRVRDVLLGMTSDRLVSAADVPRRIRTLRPGTTVGLRILRGGTVLDIPVVLGSRRSGASLP